MKKNQKERFELQTGFLPHSTPKRAQTFLNGIVLRYHNKRVAVVRHTSSKSGETGYVIDIANAGKQYAEGSGATMHTKIRNGGGVDSIFLSEETMEAVVIAGLNLLTNRHLFKSIKEREQEQKNETKS